MAFLLSMVGSHVTGGRYIANLPCTKSLLGHWTVQLVSCDLTEPRAMPKDMWLEVEGQRISVQEPVADWPHLLSIVNRQLAPTSLLMDHSGNFSLIKANHSVLAKVTLSGRLQSLVGDTMLGNGTVHVTLPDLLAPDSIVSNLGCVPLLSSVSRAVTLCSPRLPVNATQIPHNVTFDLLNAQGHPVLCKQPHLLLSLRQHE